ncbi:MAG: hypothetical protein JO033_10745 [Acidobacteriaceae bacterium]|nr:hypothetical protein [Acidobacteriaceae bacterium]MBV9501663.1 hypothetical protein [Acidobacteriaceae bacterium]
MRQTLHIFRKDIRHLRYEIAAALLIAAAFAFAGARRARDFSEPGANQGFAWGLLLFLLPLAWWILIARVVHDEPLPGDRQFWVTRPYAWKSLLGAKALFIAVFVHLPLLVADAVIIQAYGFSPIHQLTGLLWTQVLLAAAFVLPVAALSTLTAGLLQLVLTSLAFSIAVLLYNLSAPLLHRYAFWPELEWMRIYSALLLVVAASVPIIVWQYARRKTTSTRTIGVAATLLVLFGVPALPWTTAFAIQSRLPSKRVDLSSIQIAFDSNRKWAARALFQGKDQVRIELPLEITGIPSGTEVKPDGLTVNIEAAGVRSWRADRTPWTYFENEWNATSLDTAVDTGWYRQIRNEPVTFRGSLYLTLYGDGRTTVIPFQSRSVLVPNVGLCSAGPGPGMGNGAVFCSSGFRPRRDLISFSFIPAVQDGSRTRTGQSRLEFLSYSPFPAGLSLEPVTQFFSFNTEPGAFAGAAVQTLEPLAHIRREFEIRDIRLRDFEVRLTPIH